MSKELEAIEALYRQHAPTLFRRSLSLLGSVDEAHDVVQESFVRFMNAGYTKGSAFALLYRIAVNLSIDQLRGRVRHKHESCDEHDLPSDLHTGSRVESAMDLALLTRGLKDKHLEVSVLYHVDGYSQDEVAASLGLSRRSVGKTLQRVAAHIHQRAARLGYDSNKLAAGAHRE